MTPGHVYRAGIIGCGRAADAIEDKLIQAPAWSLLPHFARRGVPALSWTMSSTTPWGRDRYTRARGPGYVYRFNHTSTKCVCCRTSGLKPWTLGAAP